MLFLFQHGMEVIGFTSGEVTSLFQLIASILKLGNIDFSHRSNDDGTDGCDLSNTAGKQCLTLMVYWATTYSHTLSP